VCAPPAKAIKSVGTPDEQEQRFRWATQSVQHDRHFRAKAELVGAKASYLSWWRTSPFQNEFGLVPFSRMLNVRYSENDKTTRSSFIRETLNFATTLWYANRVYDQGRGITVDYCVFQRTFKAGFYGQPKGDQCEYSPKNKRLKRSRNSTDLGLKANLCKGTVFSGVGVLK